MSTKINTLQYVNLVDLPGGKEFHRFLAETADFTFGDTPLTLVTREMLEDYLEGDEALLQALAELPKDVYVNVEWID